MEEIRRFRDTNYGSTKDGLIYNFNTGKFLRGSISNNGYIRVVLGRNGLNLAVHRIVAECWIPIPNELKDCPTLQIDHINGIRTDNRVANIRWVSSALNRSNPITYNKTTKPVAAYYNDTGKLYKIFNSLSDAEAEGYDRRGIFKVIHHRGRCLSYKGLRWELIKKTAN